MRAVNDNLAAPFLLLREKKNGARSLNSTGPPCERGEVSMIGKAMVLVEE